MLQVGQQYVVGLGEETTRGTAVDPASGYYVNSAKVTVKQNKNTEEIEQAMNRITTRKDTMVVKWDSLITIEYYLDRKLMKLFLKALYGSQTDSTDDPESGVNTYTYANLQSNVQYTTYTITLVDQVQQYQFTYGSLQKMTISGKVGEVPKLSLEFLANKYATASGKSSSFQTSNSLFNSLDGNFYIASSYSGLDSASSTCVESVDIEFTKDLEGKHCLGNETNSDILTVGWDANLKVVKKYEDTTFNTLFQNNTAYSFRLKLEDSDVTLGTGTNPLLQFDFPNSKITEKDETAELKKIVGEEMTIIPSDDTTNGFSVAKLITDV